MCNKPADFLLPESTDHQSCRDTVWLIAVTTKQRNNKTLVWRKLWFLLWGTSKAILQTYSLLWGALIIHLLWKKHTCFKCPIWIFQPGTDISWMWQFTSPNFHIPFVVPRLESFRNSCLSIFMLSWWIYCFKNGKKKRNVLSEASNSICMSCF